ncbi:MAG: zinc dependent phospholipase C family protein [Firmicutes bacterium]|nr:zinc dependent phospholipase C family protein [Bacillota bacterium]
MPDLLTHTLFGEDILKKVNDSLSTIIKENRALFNLGCQGPDIFFYNDYLPWIKKKRGPKLGALMHNEKTAKFILEAINYLNLNVNNKEDYNKLLSYIIGFISHFELDRIAHPYIVYYTGIYDKYDKNTFQYKGNHKRLELIIDFLLLKDKKNKIATKTPLYKIINGGDNLANIISLFFISTFNKVYLTNIDKSLINDSYKDMKKVLKILYDPYGFKKTLLNVVDIATNNKFDYSNLTYPRSIKDNLDYLNINKNKWNHPCYKNEVYEYSFYELYDIALEISLSAISKTLKYLNGTIDFLTFKKSYPNVSYVTGKNTKNKCKMIYTNPIFK